MKSGSIVIDVDTIDIAVMVRRAVEVMATIAVDIIAANDGVTMRITIAVDRTAITTDIAPIVPVSLLVPLAPILVAKIAAEADRACLKLQKKPKPKLTTTTTTDNSERAHRRRRCQLNRQSAVTSVVDLLLLPLRGRITRR